MSGLLIPRATIKSIAAECGVSAQTVSRIANGHDAMHRQETVLKVREAMARLGFLPSSSARSMRSGRTGVVALLQQAGGGSYLPFELLDGISESVEAAGLQLAVARVGISPDGQLESLPKILCERRADALLVNLSGAFCERLEQEIEAKGFPSVWLNVQRNFDSVSPDDFAGGQAAAEYLRSQGAKDVFYIHSSCGAHYSAKARRDGVESGAKALGLGFNSITSTSSETFLSAADVMAFFKANGMPSSIAAYTVESLVLAVSAFASVAGAEAAAAIPKICFGRAELDFSALPAPFLRIPFREVGQDAVAMALKKLEPGMAPSKLPSVRTPYPTDINILNPA